MSEPADLPDDAADKVVKLLEHWREEADFAPVLVDIRVAAGVPCVIYQTESDEFDAREDISQDLVHLFTGCAVAIQQADYQVGEVAIIGPPQDRDTHPGR